jgi:metal-sulfur cluster biosynthetic enzyme
MRKQFAQTPVIRVELVWDPPWTPERMSETARRQLR